MNSYNSRIILASGSPRRAEIFANHGFTPVIMPMDVDESLPDGIEPHAAVETLARRKAEACLALIKSDPGVYGQYSDHLIIGSDTIVWKDEILGKPADAEDAFRMLNKIRGTHHLVITGVCLIDISSGMLSVMSDTTLVICKNYTDDDIRAYIASGEPFDKAGAYAIQGGFSKYIDHIEGDYENVVGFPFHLIKHISL